MNKYVFFVYGEGYQKCIFNAIDYDEEIYRLDFFKSALFRKLFFLHNAWPINRRVELPFKRIWFNRILKGMNISKQDEVVFLLYESFHLTYSKEFLGYLKDNYPNSKLCFMFSNPVDRYNSNKLGCISSYLDAVISFNKKDAKENGFLFCPYQPFKVPLYERQTIGSSDLFFIGADKGRLDKLIEIFEYLSSKGIRCDFYVVGVPKDKQRYSNLIHYNQRLSYDEVLMKVASTRCVLEVLQNDEKYLSIRTIEAMQYHKKLLTSSNFIMMSSLYNENVIQVFNKVDSIDVDFILNEADDNQFPDDSVWSIQTFKEFINDNILYS